MTTAAVTKKAVVRKNAVKRTRTRRGAPEETRGAPLPGALVTLDGTNYFYVSKKEFESWDEDKQLLAVAMERSADDEEPIPWEEMERLLDADKKKST